MNTLEVKRYILDNDIVTLKADLSHPGKSTDIINEFLVKHGNQGKTLPYYAVFPADGSDPITFGLGPVSKSTVLEKLKQAGPSRQLSKVADTAMRSSE